MVLFLFERFKITLLFFSVQIFRTVFSDNLQFENMFDNMFSEASLS